MDSLKIQINEKLAKRFREVAMRVFGYSKGSISKAAEASIRNWIDAIEEIERQEIENPVDAIDGLLSDVKLESVELQHKIKEMWTAMVKKNVSN